METALKVLVLVVGVTTFAGAVTTWDAMFGGTRSRVLVSALGLTGARVLYAIIGLLIALGGILALMGIIG